MERHTTASPASLGRLAVLSDGLFATAMTLLVLDLRALASGRYLLKLVLRE